MRPALTLCRPILDQLCPEPEEGWLRFCYETLAAGLFPNPSRPWSPQKSGPPWSSICNFLEWLLAQERNFCPFDPLLDPHWASPEELAGGRLPQEYAAFRRAVLRDRFPTLLRIGRDCMPFDPASHTIGVNNVAVHTAQLAQKAGLKVDIPLVSAASLSHDIGKFGCRGKDAPGPLPALLLHLAISGGAGPAPHIAHVAANHSTWDLEFENLPIESLLLIYADFRVRALRDEAGKEFTRIYSLADSYSIILSKLADVTPENTGGMPPFTPSSGTLRAFWHPGGVAGHGCTRGSGRNAQSTRPVHRRGGHLRHLSGTSPNSLRLHAPAQQAHDPEFPL